MAVQKTFSIIKPDATQRDLVGKILGRFEEEGLRVVAVRKVHLSRREAEGFYAVHRERKFFGELCDYMASAPCVVLVLEGENAVLRLRELLGATDPLEAAPGTIRAMFGIDKGQNSVHGSDCEENANVEIAYFFRTTELH